MCLAPTFRGAFRSLQATPGRLDADDGAGTTGHEAVARWVREMKPRRSEVLD